MVTKAAADQLRSAKHWTQHLLGLLAIGFLGVAASGCTAAVHGEDAEHYTVVKVYDGDTILVAGDAGRHMVRLLGIDAPETTKGKGETGQPYSQKSRRHLAGIILNRIVTLRPFGRDRYDRVLAVVHCDGQDINHTMIRVGLAEVYRGRTPGQFDKAPYLRSEAQARKAGIGMWRQGSAYVSPIRWKHPR